MPERSTASPASQQTLEMILRQHARQSGDRVFAIFPEDDEELTFADLERHAGRWCGWLQGRGVVSGDRVTIIAKKSADMLCAYFGALVGGVVVNVIDERIDPKNVAKALRLFAPKLALCDVFGSKQDRSAWPRQLQVEEMSVVAAELGEPVEAPTVDPDAPAICVFTSGSTGDPKGILSSHRNLVFAANCLRVHGLTPQDRVLGLTPLSGTNGQVFSIWAPLVTGGSSVQYQGMFNTYLALDWASAHRATWVNGTPTYLSLFLAQPVDPAEFDLSRVRFYRSASAPLPVSVHDSFETSYGIPIIETMGLSEMTGQVFANPLDPGRRKKGSVGQPISTELRIVDDSRQPVPAGETGELEVRSDGLMLGYFEDPEATSQAVVDGWLRTGDLGSQDAGGFVRIKGRKKDIAIVGGKNVSLREIDDALYELSNVRLATSFGVADERSGERIVALIQLADVARPADTDAMRHRLREVLAAEAVPSEVEVVEAIPIGGAGKVLRARAKELYGEGRD